MTARLNWDKENKKKNLNHNSKKPLLGRMANEFNRKFLDNEFKLCRLCKKKLYRVRDENRKWIYYGSDGSPHSCRQDKNKAKVCKQCGQDIWWKRLKTGQLVPIEKNFKTHTKKNCLENKKNNQQSTTNEIKETNQQPKVIRRPRSIVV